MKTDNVERRRQAITEALQTIWPDEFGSHIKTKIGEPWVNLVVTVMMNAEDEGV